MICPENDCQAKMIELPEKVTIYNNGTCPNCNADEKGFTSGIVNICRNSWRHKEGKVIKIIVI